MRLINLARIPAPVAADRAQPLPSPPPASSARVPAILKQLLQSFYDLTVKSNFCSLLHSSKCYVILFLVPSTTFNCKIFSVRFLSDWASYLSIRITDTHFCFQSLYVTKWTFMCWCAVKNLHITMQRQQCSVLPSVDRSCEPMVMF